MKTPAVILNDQVVVDKSSHMDLDVNDDGSVTLYMGPDEASSGSKNGIPTVPGKAWFPYFRFYSPTEAYFDRSWVLPDIEKRRASLYSGDGSERLKRDNPGVKKAEHPYDSGL